MLGGGREGAVMDLCVRVSVCVPVGPMRLRDLVLAGGRQGRSMLVCVRHGV